MAFEIYTKLATRIEFHSLRRKPATRMLLVNEHAYYQLLILQTLLRFHVRCIHLPMHCARSCDSTFPRNCVSVRAVHLLGILEICGNDC
jgi:hypothetical protein